MDTNQKHETKTTEQRPLSGKNCCFDASTNAYYNVHEEVIGTKSRRDGTCSRCGTNLRPTEK